MKNRLRKRLESQPKAGFGLGGKIKVGVKHPEKGYPMAVDYFVCTSDNQEYIDAFKKQYGEKPRCLKVMFTDDEKGCREYLELRDEKGKRYAASDGQDIWFSNKGEWVKLTDEQVKKKGGYQKCMLGLAAHTKTEWKHKVSLRFLIVGVKGILVEWEFVSGGAKSTIDNVINNFDNVKEIAGTVCGIVFDLLVKIVKSDKSGDNRKYPVVSLVPNISTENMVMLNDWMQSGLLKPNDMVLLNDNKVQQLKERNDSVPAIETTYEEA